MLLYVGGGLPLSTEKPEKLYSKLLKQLNFYKRNNTNFSTPVQLLSLDIFKQLLNKQLSLAELEDLVQLLCGYGMQAKTQQLKKYLGEVDVAKNILVLKKLIYQMSHELSFARFAQEINKAILGIVITAHPTFSISEDLAQIMAQTVVFSSESLKSNHRAPHRPDQPLTLDYEHKASLQVMTNIQEALSELYRTVFTVAKKRYPKEWHKLTPRLITIASWVGYDLDGRTDITWANTLSLRLESAVLQLQRYIEQCEQLLTDHAEGFSGAIDRRNILEEICKQLSVTRDTLTNEMLLLAQYTKEQNNFDPLLQLQLSNNNQARLVELSTLIVLLTQASKKITDSQILQKLFVLRAEMMNYGLGRSHIHMRINAVSCHNAIHEKIRIERLPENTAEQQYYLEALNKLYVRAKPVVINIGNILQEQASVRRLLMVMVYILKYIDATPIRFLIAEVENACSVLTVLYYAKLFGVGDKIDISPLFETPHGIHRGDEIIETLLNNIHYYSYIKKRKKLCIQTGFSDSGRYLGQITAALALERLRMKIARLFTKYDLTGVQLVIFDTHGEAIGRGGNPADICSRINYILAPANRCLFRELGIYFKHEISFQGGDGYLFFKNQELALATITRLLHNNLQEGFKENKKIDPFYTDQAYTLSFFFAVKEFHEQLFNDQDYTVLLNIYRDNMLYVTGSRSNQRQHELAAKIDCAHPSQMRAILHNAILQQLGFLLNTVSGLGQIVQKDPKKFIIMYKKSARFRCVMSMIVAADQLSSLAVLDSYVALLNPGYWLRLTDEIQTQEQKDVLKLAALLEFDQRFDSLARVVRKIKMDRIKFYNVFKEVPNKIREPVFPKEYREYLDLLHAVRIALIQQIFLIITKLPRFSSSPSGMTLNDITEMILRLEVPTALNILRLTFPVSHAPGANAQFGRTTYTTENRNDGYVLEHQSFFDPMEKIYELIRQIGAGVSYFNGAMG